MDSLVKLKEIIIIFSKIKKKKENQNKTKQSKEKQTRYFLTHKINPLPTSFKKQNFPNINFKTTFINFVPLILMDSSKRVITLKTINKLCKTSSKKKAKCKHLVTHPSRFLDPYTFHRFLSDMIIPDKLSCVSEDYLSLNALLAPTKHIFAIEEKGTSYQMNVVEKNVYKTLPVGMLSYRLRSLGDEAAYFLAQVLDEFVEIFSLIEMIRSVGHMKQVLDQIKIQNIKKILSYFDEIHRKAMSKEEWEKWREEWMEKKKNDLTYYVTYGSFKGHEGGSKIESIGINQTFQKLVIFFVFF